MRNFSLVPLLVCLSALAACSSNSAGTPTSSSSGNGSGSGSGGGGGAGGGVPIGGDRPVTVIVPSDYKPGVPAPLLVMLHGYTVSGQVEELFLQLAPMADAKGFLYAHPDGTLDKDSKYFWNATDACCDMYKTGVDDATYLSSVIDQIKAQYSVDPRRVYLVGHSNGGFMSYRMACDHADQIAAIGSLAGAMWADPSKCTPNEPVSVLQIHGTADPTVAYDGSVAANYPGAQATVKAWAMLDGCSLMPDSSAPPLDLDVSLSGAESMVERYAQGCAKGSAVELWTIQGGGHLPNLSTDFRTKLFEFLLAHPKP